MGDCRSAPCQQPLQGLGAVEVMGLGTFHIAFYAVLFSPFFLSNKKGVETK